MPEVFKAPVGTCIVENSLVEQSVDGTVHTYTCNGCGQVVHIDERTYSKKEWARFQVTRLASQRRLI